MPKTFDELWDYIVKRSDDMAFPVVQERSELEHVFNLIQGCESYLEVGTAEGNSLYVLAHAIKGIIYSIDFGEPHTKKARDEVLNYLSTIKDSPHDQGVYFLSGNSHAPHAMRQIRNEHLSFDCILIDAGHSYEDVIADAAMYGALATKYIIFHDIMLDEVAKAFDWYCKQRPDCEWYKFINSQTYGYGIMKVKND